MVFLSKKLRVKTKYSNFQIFTIRTFVAGICQFYILIGSTCILESHNKSLPSLGGHNMYMLPQEKAVEGRRDSPASLPPNTSLTLTLARMPLLGLWQCIGKCFDGGRRNDGSPHSLPLMEGDREAPPQMRKYSPFPSLPPFPILRWELGQHST